ncbi:hypothetical protein WJX79_000766 [Trebouxia sp. C0005]
MQEPELCYQPGFVAVHVGAGYHSHKHENIYLKALRSACQAAAAASSCMSGVQQAVQALEENEHTNAGIGSNLTQNGTVEADASIMLGDRTFAAVGAAPGLSSAIAAAALLAKESQQPLSLGRVRPMFLAGVEAYVWAHSKGLSTAPSIESTAKWHVIPRALEQWQKYKIMIYEDGAKKQQPAQHPSAVYIDAAGRVGAGVSSGGIAMKVPGRVGEAAMYACGCWAADADVSLGRPGVACSVSGVGEVIIRACLAKECCQRMLNLDLPVDEACSQVMQESTMQEAQPNNCGVLAVRVTFDSASPGQIHMQLDNKPN